MGRGEEEVEKEEGWMTVKKEEEEEKCKVGCKVRVRRKATKDKKRKDGDIHVGEIGVRGR